MLRLHGKHLSGGPTDSASSPLISVPQTTEHVSAPTAPQNLARPFSVSCSARCIGCSWPAWRTRLLQPRVSRSRVLYRRMLRHNSGTAASTGAGRPEERKAEMEEEETRDYNSQDLSSLFLVPQHRRPRRKQALRARKKARGKGKTGPGRRPPAGTIWQLQDLLEGGEEDTKLFHQSQGNTICYAFQEGTCQQNRARADTSALGAEEYVATSSASACRVAWRPSPEPLPHSLLSKVLPRPLLSHTFRS